MNTNREGIALIAVVLALVVLEAAIAGALFLSTLEVTTTRAFIGRARATLGAESALAATIAGWQPDAIAALAVGDTLTPSPPGTIDGATMEARIEHAWPGAYIVTGRGSVPTPAARATATAAVLLHWFSPAAFTAATQAALSTGGTATVHAGAVVDGSGTASSCPPADALAHATFPPTAGMLASDTGAANVAVGALVAGSPPVAISPTATSRAALARLGPLDSASLVALANRTESGSLVLAPAMAGLSCDTTAPGNWGEPGNPAHPCGAYLPIVHVPGDLHVVGGAGQALLVVDGDLTIDAGAEVRGVVVVHGNATVHGRIRGALRVRGDGHIDGDIRRDACALWRALTRPAPLAIPHRRSHRWRLPSF